MSSLREQRNAILQLATAKLLSKPLYIAARLGIADRLGEGPRSAAQLAGECAVDADALYRVLRALASVGIFSEDERRRFTLTPQAELLRERPNSLRPLVLWMNDPRHDRLWEGLTYSVETGEPAAERVVGCSFWTYLASQPDLEAAFSQCMAANARAMHAVALEQYQFPERGTIVDVGGCYGELLLQVLASRPSLRGVVYDRAEVIDEARRRIAAAGLQERCVAVAGDFMREVPAGDLHLLSHILHDFDDARAATILANCRKASSEAGRVVLVEMPIPGRNEPSFAKLIDIEMLVLPGGRERTLDEYQVLLANAGYTSFSVSQRRNSAAVMEARSL